MHAIGLSDATGATLKEAMQLARHSDPKLTAAVYGRARLLDLGTAVERLPVAVPAWTILAQTDDTGRDRLSPSESVGGGENENENRLDPFSKKGVEVI